MWQISLHDISRKYVAQLMTRAISGVFLLYPSLRKVFSTNAPCWCIVRVSRHNHLHVKQKPNLSLRMWSRRNVKQWLENEANRKMLLCDSGDNVGIKRIYSIVGRNSPIAHVHLIICSHNRRGLCSNGQKTEEWQIYKKIPRSSLRDRFLLDDTSRRTTYSLKSHSHGLWKGEARFFFLDWIHNYTPQSNVVKFSAWTLRLCHFETSPE